MDNISIQFIQTLLSVLTGIYLCAAMYHLCFAARKRRLGLQLSYSMMCLMAAGYCLAARAVYSSESIPTFLYALKCQLFFGIVFMASIIWFTVYFTNEPSRLSARLFSLAALSLVALNLFLPNGILIRTVHNFDRLRLPWDEHIAFPETDLSLWAAVLWSFSMAVYVFVIHGCLRLWRGGRHRAALALGANVLFLILAGLIDLTIDLRDVRWVYVAEFRFLPCVLSMAIYTSKNFGRIV